MRTVALLFAFAGLLAFNVWSLGTVAWAAFVNRGAGSDPRIFWRAVGVNLGLLVLGVWLAAKVWRRVRP